MTVDDAFKWDGLPEEAAIQADDQGPADLEILPANVSLADAPIGRDAKAVRIWFDDAIAIEPVTDGSLAAERDAAKMFQRMARADNTRIAYRAAVRAWCA